LEITGCPLVLFLLTIVLSYLLRTRGTSDLQTEGQIIQWSKEKGQEDNQRSPNRRTNNSMVKRKRTRGISDLQTEGQIIQWSKEKGQEDNQ
jgi:hypothetical protein